MKPFASTLLLAVVALGQIVEAGDTTYWATTTCWSTVHPEQQPTTIWSVSTCTETQYSTTTSVQLVPTTITTTEYKTISSTEYKTISTTEYQTVPTTEYKTVPTTAYTTVPTTITSVQTQPTTIVSVQTQFVTAYVTNVVPTTVINSQTIYDTVLSTATQVNTVQVQNTITKVSTQYQTTTALSVQLSTLTVTNSLFVTQTATCPTSSTLTGLVLCTSRIINPTYTPPAPLPSNYQNGCPPGYLCIPTKENCNFEQNSYAPSYICPPAQCKLAASLPPPGPVVKPLGTNCAWLTPDAGYADLDPRPWGYSYAIFNIFGQPQCPASCPPVSTVTITTTIAASAPAPAPSSSSTTTTTKLSTSTWGDWSSSAKVTARATLRKRADVFWPSACYDVCDQAQKIGSSIGFDAAQLCPDGSGYSLALSSASDCSLASAGYGPYNSVALLSIYDSYCSSVNGELRKRMADTQLAILVSSPDTVLPAQSTLPVNSPAQATAVPGTISELSHSSSTITYLAPSQSISFGSRSVGKASDFLIMFSSLIVLMFSL